MTPRWHGSVGYILTGRDGEYHGSVGMHYPCDNQADGWAKAIAWLKKHKDTGRFFQVRTFRIEVTFF